MPAGSRMKAGAETAPPPDDRLKALDGTRLVKPACTSGTISVPDSAPPTGSWLILTLEAIRRPPLLPNHTIGCACPPDRPHGLPHCSCPSDEYGNQISQRRVPALRYRRRCARRIRSACSAGSSSALPPAPLAPCLRYRA